MPPIWVPWRRGPPLTRKVRRLPSRVQEVELIAVGDALEALLVGIADDGVLVLGDEREDRPVDHLAGGVAEHPRGGRVDEGELAVGVGQDEALGHRLDRAFAEPPELFELLLGAQPLGDVLEDADDPGDLPVGLAVGRLDEDDMMLAVPGLEGGLVDLVPGLGEQRLVVLQVLLDDVRRGRRRRWSGR